MLVTRQCFVPGFHGLALGLLFLSFANTRAEVALSQVFGDNMILQRDGPVPVYGTASAGQTVIVQFHGQSLTAVADTQGNWQVTLAAMSSDAAPATMTVTGGNTVIFHNVLVGDVWLCSGQSNMEMRLGACNRPADIEDANFPGIRQFVVPGTPSGVPLKTVRGNWTVCKPASAAGFTASGFYFARKIYQDQNKTIPIALILAAVGGTRIDSWLAPEGLIDIPALHPLLSQNSSPDGPFELFNGMIHPLAPYAIKGVIWYQGENGEITPQSPDSYYLKMKALIQGWKQAWGMETLPFYYVMIANWGEQPKSAAPVLKSAGWDADTRLQQINAMALPQAGCASAIDIGDSSMGAQIWDGWHPKDKLDVGERLALWALKNDYGHRDLVTSGPVLRDAIVSGHTVICSFDNIGNGLMVGSKEWYTPTKEIVGKELNRFVLAGKDANWFPASAVISNHVVLLSSSSVASPRGIAYACWQNPSGCDLYNKEGLPAAPFYIEDITKHYQITASAGKGGSIAPSGSRSLLQRMTALYTISPEPGYFVEDVTVDGASVGSVHFYTFDPLYADHSIKVTFSPVRPDYTITATTGGGGKLYPEGLVRVKQGESKPFVVRDIGNSQVEMLVDGVRLGQRSLFLFSDIRSDHTISCTFSPLINGTVGYGGTITPCGVVAAPYGANKTFVINSIPGYSIFDVKIDGADLGPVTNYTFSNVTQSHLIAARFRSIAPATVTAVPRIDQLLIACRGDALPAEGGIAAWPMFDHKDTALKRIGVPNVESIDGVKYAQIHCASGDGFSAGTFSSSIACSGATVVAVARPVRNGLASPWTSIVDVFYDRLVLGIRNDSGLVCVRRNGSLDNSRIPIPDGQITILSLVVQADGTYQVFANGSEIMANSSTNRLTTLVPAVAGDYATSITIGRNAPDSWTTFNGDIGDIFIYKTSLTTEERRQLESLIAASLAGAESQKFIR